MIYYDMTEHGKLLADYKVYRDMLLDWEDAHLDDDKPSTETLNKYTEISKKITEITQKYLKMTPVIPLSRCPYSGEVTYYSIDHFGIDGPWWDYTKPLRALSNLPVTFHTVTGSLKLNGKPERMQFQVRPGPERPYLIKQLIESPGVKAVISTAQIGKHTGCMVFYYKEDVNTSVEPARLWGQYLWESIDRWGKRIYLEPDERDFSYIFNLEDWVEEGKLLWIQPDDKEFTLRTGVNGCPYLNMVGDTRFQIIIDGEVTHREDEE
ncbi:hypothetical protein MUP51_10215 [Candidatus Bathyarchaeota archaeon]|nr:hypothetical protein [Candidatus Bathyarchaeota archaeon]